TALLNPSVHLLRRFSHVVSSYAAPLVRDRLGCFHGCGRRRVGRRPHSPRHLTCCRGGRCNRAVRGALRRLLPALRACRLSRPFAAGVCTAVIPPSPSAPAASCVVGRWSSRPLLPTGCGLLLSPS